MQISEQIYLNVNKFCHTLSVSISTGADIKLSGNARSNNSPLSSIYWPLTNSKYLRLLKIA